MPDLNEIERAELCQTTIESLYEATGGLKQFPALLKKVIATKAWERRTVHGKVVELGSLRELITSKPVSGWGEDPSKVEAVIRDDPEALAAFRDAMKHQGERTDLGDNVPQVKRPERSNSRAYSISRVQRDCNAETVAAVMSGEMSANAALVKAGVRENRQVYIPRDPSKAVEKLRLQFGHDFIEGIRSALNGR
jgi:hypothetical protein